MSEYDVIRAVLYITIILIFIVGSVAAVNIFSSAHSWSPPPPPKRNVVVDRYGLPIMYEKPEDRPHPIRPPKPAGPTNQTFKSYPF
jgi:hypothetical protein